MTGQTKADAVQHTEAAPAVALDDVSLVFGGDTEADRVLALDSVSLSIPAGQFVAVVGPSGCGKTTILNMLAGLLEPTVGTVMRHGRPVDGTGHDIGYMLARSALAPWRTARRNVEIGPRVQGALPRATARSEPSSCSTASVWQASRTSSRRSCRRGCASVSPSPALSRSSPTCG